MEKKVNVDQICIVKIYINARYPWYKWRERNFWGRKEGFYFIFTLRGAELTTVEEIVSDERLRVEDKDVFYKPHIEFHMSSGKKVEKFFESESDLRAFMLSDSMNGIKWIDV